MDEYPVFEGLALAYDKTGKPLLLEVYLQDQYFLVSTYNSYGISTLYRPVA